MSTEQKEMRARQSTRAFALAAALTALASAASLTAFAQTRDLKVEGKKPADFVAEQTGRSWAVVIGIDEYQHAPRLKYAVADAKATAMEFERRGYQVTTLFNGQATEDAIEGELGDKLLDRVGENDRVVIFYAGHGETKTVKGGKTQGFLLPVNARPDALSQSAISMGRIRELADALPAKQVLFLVDVCYGGIAGQQFRSLPGYNEDYLRVLTRERGRQLITAGGAGQQAMEGPEWGHSVFSYYLLEGLQKGLADLNGDGIVPASELYSYLDARVFAAAQMKGHEQRPELWALAAEKGEFVFFTKPQPKVAREEGEASTPDEVARLRAELDALKAQVNQKTPTPSTAPQAGAKGSDPGQAPPPIVESRERPVPPAKLPGARLPQFFTFGSSREEVVAVQGKPDQVRPHLFRYGRSFVYFQDGRVRGWRTAPADPLRVKLFPGGENEPHDETFTVGSTMREVAAVQGTPDSFSETVWAYGRSMVMFKGGHVTNWRAVPESPLKVR
jgi:uncharacterized caspase-like protein